MSDPVRIVVGSGESAEIRVASSSESAEIRIPESGLIVGPPGPQGPAGADGADGKSAYQIALDNGFVGTEAEWLASLVGPQGETGEQGPQGVKGDTGDTGPQGPAGADGSDGQDGTDGTTFTPSVDSSGNLSWTNDGGKQNPPTVNIKGPAGTCEMTILSYGSSTWADFIAAYNSNSIVYCRASSNSNPATGNQGRMAFMAYVNLDSGGTPTSVEFQYYRSVSSHSDSQQGDQVYIYKLTSAGAWSVTVREAYTKIAAGSNMSSSYANGTLTLNATGGGGGTSDYDDLTDKPSINNVTLSGNKTAAELGLATPSDIPTVPVQSVNGKTGEVVLDASDVGAGTYSKPSGGIPASDLASAVLSPYRTATAQDAIDATEVIVVNIASYSGSQVRVPASGTNAAITGDHVLLYAALGTPTNQTGDWTVTTYDGYLTLSGSASAATTVKLVLGKAGTTI